MKDLFCEMCGKMLLIKDGMGKCKCGFEKKVEHTSTTETIKEKPEIGKGIAQHGNILATFPHKCKKCNHDKAQVIDLGVWYGDEAGVVRYKCGKCGFTEQDQQSNT